MARRSASSVGAEDDALREPVLSAATARGRERIAEDAGAGCPGDGNCDAGGTGEHAAARQHPRMIEDSRMSVGLMSNEILRSRSTTSITSEVMVRRLVWT